MSERMFICIFLIAAGAFAGINSIGPFQGAMVMSGFLGFVWILGKTL